MTEDISQTEAQTEQEKKLPDEKDAPLLLMIGVAQSACAMVKDEEKRGKCVSMVEAMGPENVKNDLEIMKKMLDEVGLAGLAPVTEHYNNLLKSAHIERCNEILARGEKLAPSDEYYYKLWSKERMP